MRNTSWICESCRGAGGYSDGDCEDGEWVSCPQCDGVGEESC